jgi:hypothetical protein
MSGPHRLRMIKQQGGRQTHGPEYRACSTAVCSRRRARAGARQRVRQCEAEDAPWKKARRVEPSKPPWKAKRTQSRAVDNTAADEDKAKFVPVLVDIMTQANALKPTGKLGEDKEAWQAALRRRAIVKVEQSEKATLARVQRTWQELVCFTQRNDLGIEDLGVVALEKFLYEGEAQARTTAAMRWMKNNLHLQWPIQDVIQPTKTGIQRCSSQATCAEPAMVVRLEVGGIVLYRGLDRQDAQLAWRMAQSHEDSERRTTSRRPGGNPRMRMFFCQAERKGAKLICLLLHVARQHGGGCMVEDQRQLISDDGNKMWVNTATRSTMTACTAGEAE